MHSIKLLIFHLKIYLYIVRLYLLKFTEKISYIIFRDNIEVGYL